MTRYICAPRPQAAIDCGTRVWWYGNGPGSCAAQSSDQSGCLIACVVSSSAPHLIIKIPRTPALHFHGHSSRRFQNFRDRTGCSRTSSRLGHHSLPPRTGQRVRRAVVPTPAAVSVSTPPARPRRHGPRTLVCGGHLRAHRRGANLYYSPSLSSPSNPSNDSSGHRLCFPVLPGSPPRRGGQPRSAHPPLLILLVPLLRRRLGPGCGQRWWRWWWRGRGRLVSLPSSWRLPPPDRPRPYIRQGGCHHRRRPSAVRNRHGAHTHLYMADPNAHAHTYNSDSATAPRATVAHEAPAAAAFHQAAPAPLRPRRLCRRTAPAPLLLGAGAGGSASPTE